MNRATGKHKLIGMIGIILLLAAGGYAGANLLLVMASNAIAQQVRGLNVRAGTSNFNPWYEDVSLTSWNTVSWDKVGLTFNLLNQSTGTRVGFLVRADSASATLNGFHELHGDLQVNDVTISSQTPGRATGAIGALSRLRISLSKIRIPFSLDIYNPRASLKAVLSAVAEVVEGHRARHPISLEGIIEFPIRGKVVKARMFSRRFDDGFGLALNEKDVLKISGHLKDRYTPTEARIVSQYPLRAPLLIQIRDRARTRSEAAARIDPDLPEDAYRHVLWSYLLTKRFDHSFARSITDAHEAETDLRHTEDSLMDYQNNAVGRRYALEKVSEDEIISLIKTDPRVIRTVN